MIFKRLAPDPGLEHLIECYSTISGDGKAMHFLFEKNKILTTPITNPTG